MNIPLRYCEFGGLTNGDRLSSYAYDLVTIIKAEGDCFNIPCYENDCTIYDWCLESDNTIHMNERLVYCRNKLKEIPEDIIFEVAL